MPKRYFGAFCNTVFSETGQDRYGLFFYKVICGKTGGLIVKKWRWKGIFGQKNGRVAHTFPYPKTNIFWAQKVWQS